MVDLITSDRAGVTENGVAVIDVLANDSFDETYSTTIAKIDGADVFALDPSDIPFTRAPDNAIAYAGLASGATVYVLDDLTIAYDTATGPFIIADEAVSGFDELGEGEIYFDLFTYTLVSDDGLATATATVVMRITGENDAPRQFFGFSDYAFTEGSGSYTQNLVPILDPDHDLDELTYEFIDLPQVNGEDVAVTLNGDGTFTVDTDVGFDSLSAGETLTYTFTYRATDPLGASGGFFQQFTVEGVGAAGPVADGDAAETLENAGVEIDVLDNDTGDGLSIVEINGAAFGDFGGFMAAELPSRATVILNDDGALTYSPFPLATANPEAPFDFLQEGQSVVDSFEYTIEDADGLRSTAVVDVTLNGVNDPPGGVGNAISQPTFTEGTGFQTGVMLIRDYDDDIETLDVTLIDAPELNGETLSIDVGAGPDFGVDTDEYADMAAGERILFSFTYQLTDPQGATSGVLSQSYWVEGVGDAAGVTANDDAASTGETSPVGIDFVANDVGEDLVVTQINGADLSGAGDFVFAELPSGAALLRKDDGSFDYLPTGLAVSGVITNFDPLQEGETALDTFEVTVANADGETATSTATVTIVGENDAPFEPNAISLPIFTEGGGLQFGQFVVTDADDEEDDLEITIIEAPTFDGVEIDVAAGLGVQFAVDGDVGFDSLAAGELVTLSFTYTATDPQGASSPVLTQSFAVEGVGDPVGETVVGTEGDDLLVGTNDAEAIVAGAGDDQIFGRAGEDDIDAGDGQDSAFGGGDDDTIDGGAGSDFLQGGAGDDVIYGGKGFDKIQGSAGDDELYGGAGADTFQFRMGWGVDTIADFEVGADKIRVFGLAPEATLTQTGDDCEITFSDDAGLTVILENVDCAGLTIDDFIFT